ncbi:hypothetical protein AAVH_06373 [Aphelenchoides avenae]|nr:hypothetical protein AAVH_06373 [Aphelenchus avenae]
METHAKRLQAAGVSPLPAGSLSAASRYDDYVAPLPCPTMTMTDEQSRSKRLRYNRILGRLDSVIHALVTTKPSFILEEAELGQLSTQPLPLSSVVQRHFRGLVLDTSKNVVAFTCPDVENLECDWNITAALNDLLADDLTEERPKERKLDAVPTTSVQTSIIAPNEAIQAPAASAPLPSVSDSRPSVQPMTPREELLSSFIDPAFLDEALTEDPALSIQPVTENMELLSNFLDPELLREVMSSLKPDKDDALMSVSADVAEKDAIACQPIAELLNEVLSVLTPDQDDASASACEGTAEQVETASGQPAEGRHTKKNRRKNARRAAFKAELLKFALYDSDELLEPVEEPSVLVTSKAVDEASRCPGHPVSESHDTPDVEVNEMDRSFGGKLRKRYWAKLTNPPETMLKRTAEHNAESDEESGPWRPQMATKCRIADGCANHLAEHEEAEVGRGSATTASLLCRDIHYHPPPSEATNRTFSMEYPKYRVRRDSLWATSWEDIQEDYPRAVFFGLKAVDFVTRGKVSSMLYPGYSG